MYTRRSKVRWRVLRGGSWFRYARYLRTVHRDRDTSGCRRGYIGFRVIKERVMSDQRVLRGGSWNNSQDYARADSRLNYHPDYRFDFDGFRVIRELKNA